MIQGSSEWFQARLGKASASRIGDVMALKRDGKPTAARDEYMGELLAERLSGVAAPRVTTAAMQWGVDHEPAAIAAYEFDREIETQEVGFLDHPTISMCGASPDRLVGDDGLVEAKCPLTKTHIDTLISGNIQPRYFDQMQWQLEVTGREWCDFISFDPRLPEAYKLFVKRVPRDEERIKAIKIGVSKFLAEIESSISSLRLKYERLAA